MTKIVQTYSTGEQKTMRASDGVVVRASLEAEHPQKVLPKLVSSASQVSDLMETEKRHRRL